jgi:hypothetical protein
MKFVLNDACFDDDLVLSDCDNRIRNLLSILKVAEHQSYTVHKHISNIENWLKSHSDLLENSLIIQLRQYLQKIEPTPKLDNPNTHFFHFNHQDTGTESLIHTADDRVTDTALAFAAEQTQQAQSLSIINITKNEKFGKRPFLPVLISPHQVSKPDVLVNIPCFDTVQAIENIEYYLLFQRFIQPFVEEKEIENVRKAFLEFKTQHDNSKWQPKQMDSKNEKLLSEHAFPATNNDVLKDVLIDFKKILPSKTEGSYEDNKAVYTAYAYAAATLNGYFFNEKMSAHYNYHIFEGGCGNKKLFLSADTENGGFEVIERNGTHIGVYSYDGTCIETQYKDQKKLNSHSLRDITASLFLFP